MTFGYYGQRAQQPAGAGTRASAPSPSTNTGSGGVNLGNVLAGLQQTTPLASQNNYGGGSQPAGGSPAAATGGGGAGGGVTLSQVMQGLQQGQGGGGGGQNQSGGGAGGQPSGGGGGGMGNLGRFGLAVGGLVGGTLAANAALNRMSDAALRANSVLEEYNGGIAAANAYAQAASVARNIRQGEEISGGYGRLSETQSEYRDLTTELSAPFQNLGMHIAASIGNARNDVMATFVEWMQPVIEVAREVSTWLGGGQQDGLLTARAFLSDASDGKLDGIGTAYMNPSRQALHDPNDPNRDARLRQQVFGR